MPSSCRASAALAYASESMRLTTRLMQIASWLLLQRAINEGEMTETEAASDKRRSRIAWQQMPVGAETAAEMLLPNPLHGADRAARLTLQERITPARPVA